jgi:hypothetical protein
MFLLVLAGGEGEGIDIDLMRESLVSFPSLALVQIKYIGGLAVGAPRSGEIYPRPDEYQRQQHPSFVVVFLIITMTHGSLDMNQVKRQVWHDKQNFVDKQEGQADWICVGQAGRKPRQIG